MSFYIVSGFAVVWTIAMFIVKYLQLNTIKCYTYAQSKAEGFYHNEEDFNVAKAHSIALLRNRMRTQLFGVLVPLTFLTLFAKELTVILYGLPMIMQSLFLFTILLVVTVPLAYVIDFIFNIKDADEIDKEFDLEDKNQTWFKKAWSIVFTTILTTTILTIFAYGYASATLTGIVISIGLITIVYVALNTVLFGTIVTVLMGREVESNHEILGDLREYMKSNNMPISNIKIISGQKPNAFLGGWGSFKRVGIVEKCFEVFTTNEIKAIIAHEVGHNVHKHLVKGIAITMGVLTLSLLNVINAMQSFEEIMGMTLNPSLIALMALILISPIVELSRFFGLSKVARENEYEADAFAVSDFGAQTTQEMLIKLVEINKMLPVTNKWYEKCNTHPSPLARIAAIQKQKHS